MADGKIERDEFREALEPFLARSSDILSIEWVPRVPGDEREKYETAAQREGVEGFHFTAQNAKGDIVSDPLRNEYFPIYYIGPQQGSNIAYGYDLASEPVRWEALQWARDSGDIVASGQIAFLKNEHSAGGFFVCLPVYEKNQPTKTRQDRKKNLKGFILGVFKPSDMIQSALRDFQPEGIDFGLWDPSDTNGLNSFHYHASRLSEDASSPMDPRRLLETEGIHYSLKLGLAGHPWTIVGAPTAAFTAAHRTWWPVAVLAAGLLFTLMASGYLSTNLRYSAELEEKVEAQTREIRVAQEEVLYRLAFASQCRDEETPMHLRRIGLMSRTLARGADWFSREIEIIGQAAPMHDIGKIGVPDAILRKTEKLSPEELEVLKTHTLVGAEILAGSNVPMLKMAHDIALGHHERWDGKGYPRGLSGKNIPECARIVAVVDAYDTLTHKTADRPALEENEALSLMREESGKAFDPQLLAAFMRRLPEIHGIEEQFPDRNFESSAAAATNGPIAVGLADLPSPPPTPSELNR
jgi:CHASE1-domain containing sensor protein